MVSSFAWKHHNPQPTSLTWALLRCQKRHQSAKVTKHWSQILISSWRKAESNPTSPDEQLSLVASIHNDGPQPPKGPHNRLGKSTCKKYPFLYEKCNCFLSHFESLLLICFVELGQQGTSTAHNTESKASSPAEQCEHFNEWQPECL